MKQLMHERKSVRKYKQGVTIPQEVLMQLLQDAILYALTKGHLDDIPVQDIVRFENEFLSWLDTNHTNVLDHVRTTKELAPDAEYVAALTEFKKTFAKSE